MLFLLNPCSNSGFICEWAPRSFETRRTWFRDGNEMSGNFRHIHLHDWRCLLRKGFCGFEVNNLVALVRRGGNVSGKKLRSRYISVLLVGCVKSRGAWNRIGAADMLGNLRTSTPKKSKQTTFANLAKPAGKLQTAAARGKAGRRCPPSPLFFLGPRICKSDEWRKWGEIRLILGTFLPSKFYNYSGFYWNRQEEKFLPEIILPKSRLTVHFWWRVPIFRLSHPNPRSV